MSRSKTIREMKRIIWIVVLGALFFLPSSCKTDGMRYYYCLSGDQCVTVWKRGSGEVYIIPSVYKESKEPNVNFIKTINEQFLTLYFSKNLPNKIIVRDEGNLKNNKKMYSIENNKMTGKWKFLEYSADYKNVLYNPDATKFKDVKFSTDYLIINIEENYATNKIGKKIK